MTHDHSAPGVQDAEEATRRYALRHHTLRFALFFAIFAVVSAANIVMLILDVHGVPAGAALAGIIVTTPAYLYHEVRAVRAGATLGDIFGSFRRVFHSKGRSSNG